MLSSWPIRLHICCFSDLKRSTSEGLKNNREMFHSGLLKVGFVLFCLFKVLAPIKREKMVIILSSVEHTRNRAGQGGMQLVGKGALPTRVLLCFFSQEKKEVK